MQGFNVRSMVFDGYPCKYDIKSQFTIVTRMLSFLYTDNSLCELSVNRKLSILVAMVTEPWHNILFARIVYHTSDIKILHIAIICERQTLAFSQANIFFFFSHNHLIGVIRVIYNGLLQLSERLLRVISEQKNEHFGCLVDMVTEPWHNILFARISIVYHVSDIKILRIAIIL